MTTLICFALKEATAPFHPIAAAFPGSTVGAKSLQNYRQPISSFVGAASVASACDRRPKTGADTVPLSQPCRPYGADYLSGFTATKMSRLRRSRKQPRRFGKSDTDGTDFHGFKSVSVLISEIRVKTCVSTLAVGKQSP